MIVNPLLIFIGFLNFFTPDTLHTSTEKFSIEGALDIYYAFDFNRPLNKNRQYTTQAARHNEFNVNWTFIRLGYADEHLRGKLALHSGTYAIFNYAEEPNQLLKMIAQANAGIRLAPNIWIDAGILPSHIGYENTLSADNEIYTRSLMAENSPYFSTGVQLSAGLSEELNLSMVLLNGWQNITETNNAKSIGLNLNFKPNSTIEFNYSNYYGNEGDQTTGRKTRFFNHVYIRYQFTPKFHSAISFDIGDQELLYSFERKTWHTGLLICQYKFTEKISLAGRIEYYHDPHQILVKTFTPHGFQTISTTLNLNFAPSPNAVFRIEGRKYNSMDNVFNESKFPESKNYLMVSSLTLTF